MKTRNAHVHLNGIDRDDPATRRRDATPWFLTSGLCLATGLLIELVQRIG